MIRDAQREADATRQRLLGAEQALEQARRENRALRQQLGLPVEEGEGAGQGPPEEPAATAPSAAGGSPQAPACGVEAAPVQQDPGEEQGGSRRPARRRAAQSKKQGAGGDE
jgi:hypothetical protein